MMPLTQSEIKHIADESAKAALRDMLTMMGVDASDPEAIIAMQKDFAHIRKWRESVDAMGLKALLIATGVIVTGALGAIWVSLRGAH